MTGHIRMELAVVALTLVAARGLAAQDFRAEDVISVERGALDRWGRGEPQGFLDAYAPEITYFDISTEKRVDGLDAIKARFAPLAGKVKVDRYEMIDPKVQRHGDVAVLTYNLVNFMKGPDGAEKPFNRWNSTSMYRKIDGRWRMIHSHWSLTTPELKQ